MSSSKVFNFSSLTSSLLNSSYKLNTVLPTSIPNSFKLFSTALKKVWKHSLYCDTKDVYLVSNSSFNF